MSGSHINWDNLRIFLAVARSQSALEAASRLGLDHSTITRRLQKLEQDIGSKLFDRNRQGHTLTQAGHRLLESTESMEGTLAAAESEIGGDSHVLTGQVRLGSTEGFGSFFLAPHLANFCARHPSMSVDLLPMPRFLNLSKREADIAISIERPQSGAYIICKLADYRLQLYATRAYLDTHPPITSHRDLAAHNFIGYADELVFSAEQRYLGQIAQGAPVSLRSTSVVAQLYAAQRGKALAVLPCFMGSTCPDLIPILPDQVDVVRSFWMISPIERREIARVRALWEFLRSMADANRGFLMGEAKQIVWG